MQRLTKNLIESQSYPANGQLFLRDDELKGFGLRITANCKSFFVEGRINGTNRRITIGRHGVLPLQTARREAKRLLCEMRLGVIPPRTRSTQSAALKEVLEKFLAERNMKTCTKDNYRRLVKRLLGDWLDLPINCITKEMVSVRHRELVRPTRCGTDNRACANSVMQILNSLMKFADYGYERPLVEANPVKILSQRRQWYRVEPRQGVIPDPRLADFYRALMSEDSKIARDFILLLLFTGLRRSEASRLKWTDIDLEARELTIPAAGTKSGREHCLPLSDFMVALLQSRHTRRQTEFVFPGRDGGCINEPRAPLARIRKALGWNWLFHDLRRTFLTAGEKLRVQPLVLKKLANHSIHHDATNCYLVLDVEYLREPVNLITNRLLSLMSSSIDDWKVLDEKERTRSSCSVSREKEEAEEFYW